MSLDEESLEMVAKYSDSDLTRSLALVHLAKKNDNVDELKREIERRRS